MARIAAASVLAVFDAEAPAHRAAEEQRVLTVLRRAGGTAGAVLAALRGVIAVHDLHLFSLASERAVLIAHLEVSADTDVAARDELIQRGQVLLAERFGIRHATLQVEARPCPLGCSPAL